MDASGRTPVIYQPVLLHLAEDDGQPNGNFRSRLNASVSRQSARTQLSSQTSATAGKSNDDSCIHARRADLSLPSSSIQSSSSFHNLADITQSGDHIDGASAHFQQKVLARGEGRLVSTNELKGTFSKQSFKSPIADDNLKKAIVSEEPKQLINIIVTPLYEFLVDLFSDDSQSPDARVNMTKSMSEMARQLCQFIPGIDYHHAKLTCSPKTVSENYIYDLAKPLINESQLFGKLWLDKDRKCTDIDYPQARCFQMDKMLEASIEFLGKRYESKDGEMYTRARAIRETLKLVKANISSGQRDQTTYNLVAVLFTESLRFISEINDTTEYFEKRQDVLNTCNKLIAEIDTKNQSFDQVLTVVISLVKLTDWNADLDKLYEKFKGLTFDNTSSDSATIANFIVMREINESLAKLKETKK